MSNKTVFILGAGFSMDAGAPSQAGIIEAIYNLDGVFPKRTQIKIDRWIKQFDHFLRNCLMVDDGEKKYYTLEDIYTPIDRSIADSTSFKSYTPQQLLELRDYFNRLIILAVRNEIEKSTKSKANIRKFAEYIVRESKIRLDDEKKDGVAVITTNWDIMLDNIMFGIISDEPRPKNLKFSGVIDYCCYISSLDEHDHRIKPGLYAIGKGRYNVKILKLHGSLNWLQCPKCQRLYVKFYKRWNGGYVFNKKYCRHCERNYKEINQPSSKLVTNLIMPTFLKNLNNVQHKLIWQNAGIELSEASKIVFIGYSLPQADFEFKQLLSRMIRPDAEIEVILKDVDDPSKYSEPMKYQTAGYRFANFFSGRKMNINYDGVEYFVDNLT